MKKHIFLVEEEKDEMLFLMEALKQVQIPFKCTWAHNGEQALNQLPYLLPDIILLNLSLPGGNGLNYLNAIRSMHGLQDVPVLLYSSDLPADVSRHALALGASACLEIPSSIHELAAILSPLLNEAMEMAAS